MVVDQTTDRLAMPGKGGTVLIVDVQTGQIETLPGTGSILTLGFARQGELLVIVSRDGTVRLWDIEQGASAGLVWDGSGAASAGVPWYDDTTDTVWVAASGQLLQIPVDPQRWVDKACEILGRDFTEQEWERFVPDDEPLQPGCN
jgi:WD40 repeat protein